MNVAVNADHRRHHRCAIKGDVFIGTRPIFQIVGKLKDISEGGAGFEYIAGSGNFSSRTVEADIICGKHFRLSRLPCRVAYDIPMDQPSSGDNRIRRCGLEFGRLSYQQADLLGLILANFA